MYAEQGAENRAQILLRIGRRHWLRELSQSHIKEFLDDLVADNAFLGRKGFADQLRRLSCLRGGVSIERVDEDIRVQKESIAHSFRPC
jgi:hypothetical protein